MLKKIDSILLVSAILFVAQIAYFYPLLPARIASHFDAFGTPDGWMSKQSFIIFEFVLLAFILGLTAISSKLMKILPDSLINMPNKEFWLAPERRENTFAKISEKMKALQIALIFLFIGINHFAFQTNIYGGKLSNATWLIIAVFLAFIGIWTIKFYKEFGIKSV